MQRFENLRVWQTSHAWLLLVYRSAARFPSFEKYGITAQLRRAALSVPNNIVEGARRAGKQDYSRFLNLAQASLAEAEYLLLAAQDLGYAKAEEVRRLRAISGRIARMLHALRARVEAETPECA
jgi:four helix bundle protein